QPWTNALKVESAQLSFPSVPDVDVLLSATQTNNFELQMRQAELEQQGFRVSLAKNEKNPAVTVGPYLAQERAGDRETHVGIGLSLPLPLWIRSTGKCATDESR